jgi:HPt (histidine-containing phosphotransfer) domain-containing protein
MLIYNHQKELMGVDEHSLKTLGFSTFSQLISEVEDFADLFVKTPGYIHNFKHLHWIDFLTCADPNQESKVIIKVKDKNFRCNLDIKVIYLKEDLNEIAYAVNLLNLKALTQTEYEMAKENIEHKPALCPNISLDILEDDYEQDEVEEECVEVKRDELEEEDTIYIDEFEDFIVDAYEDEPLEIEEELPVSIYGQFLEIGSDYIYNPQLASDELGLPLELIEEFVQDFISQANEFKEDLYTSLSEHNIENVKILSHKLKGVAANLRIEDAFEVLNRVNSSENLLELKQSLNKFYEMVQKLGERKTVKDKMPLEEQIFEPELKKEEVQSYYDRARAAREIGIDMQSFNELFADFMDEAKDYISQMQKAIKNGDFEASKKASVKLKRMCETIGVDSFAEELDTILKTQDLNALEENVASISTKLNLISIVEN